MMADPTMPLAKRYSELILSAAQHLRQSGVDQPQREARLLMAAAANMSTTDLMIREMELAPVDVANAYDAMIARRSQREPFAHIVGHRDFYGLSFVSDARALVPRPDSEVVVEKALNLLDAQDARMIADLGTGTGCLLISILTARTNLRGTGIEISEAAAELAKQNVQRHGVADRADIRVMPWRDWDEWGEMDLIISNPPYIRQSVLAELAPEVRLYDPVRALDGGDDGLAAYRELISLASTRMKAGGYLVLEIGFDQNEQVTDLLVRGGFHDICGYQDMNGLDRVVTAIKPVSE